MEVVTSKISQLSDLRLFVELLLTVPFLNNRQLNRLFFIQISSRE